MGTPSPKFRVTYTSLGWEVQYKDSRWWVIDWWVAASSRYHTTKKGAFDEMKELEKSY